MAQKAADGHCGWEGERGLGWRRKRLTVTVAGRRRGDWGSAREELVVI